MSKMEGTGGWFLKNIQDDEVAETDGPLITKPLNTE